MVYRGRFFAVFFFFVMAVFGLQFSQAFASSCELDSIIKFFIVEFRDAQVMSDELLSLHPKRGSNESELLNILGTYLSRLKELGAELKAHKETNTVSPSTVLSTLKVLDDIEVALITKLQSILFEKFNSNFIKHRSQEENQAEGVNQIWDRAIHHRAIDFYQLMKENVHWVPDKSIEIGRERVSFFRWISGRLNAAEGLLIEDSGFPIDKTLLAELNSEWRQCEAERKRGEKAKSSKKVSEATPLLKVRKESIPANSFWKTHWQDVSTTTFEEFRRNLGPGLMR